MLEIPGSLYKRCSFLSKYNSILKRWRACTRGVEAEADFALQLIPLHAMDLRSISATSAVLVMLLDER